MQRYKLHEVKDGKMGETEQQVNESTKEIQSGGKTDREREWRQKIP